MRNFVIQKWNGKEIHIREDRYVNATEMAKATEKRLDVFLKSQETQEYLRVLSNRCNLPVAKRGVIPPNGGITTKIKQVSYLIETLKGTGGGTYFYPKLALRFAQWCSAEFAVQVDFWLDDMLMGKNSKTLPFAPDRHTYIYRPLEEGKSPWDLMFEKPLYDQLYALDNRVNEEPYNQHPPYFAQYTIKYIYDELMDIAPKQIYEELRLLRANDNRPKGLRMLHQYLSEEGKILLCKTIGAITELVRQANNVSPYPHIKKNYLALKLAERKGQLTLPIYDEFALKGSQNRITNHNDFENQLIEKVVPSTTKSFLRQSAKILEINYQHIIFGVGSKFLKDIGNKQTQAIELAVEAVLKENLTVMFKTYEEYLFGGDKKENA